MTAEPWNHAKSAYLHQMRFEFCVLLHAIVGLQFCFDLLVFASNADCIWNPMNTSDVMHDSKHRSHISLSFENVSCSRKYKKKIYSNANCLNARSEFSYTIGRFKVRRTREKCQKAGSTRLWLSTPLPLLETHSRPILGTKYSTSIRLFSVIEECLHHRNEAGITLPWKILFRAFLGWNKRVYPRCK